ncbi:MAG TPA: ABC transporter permease [Allosphingosinicella sp.]|nr:ABC transporter permease [Allosphingosinicella sp.]
MNRLFAASWVIARRDFVATVWSRSFLLFLLAPIVTMVFVVLAGELTGRADVAATRPAIAVAMETEDSAAIRAAYERLGQALGNGSLAELKFEAPAPNPAAQARLLLSSREEGVSAVLTGSVRRPTLTGPGRALEGLGKQVGLLIEEARRSEAMRAAGVTPAPVAIARVPTAESRGSMNMVQHGLARGSQLLVFFLTLMLATMLLSNLVEEKSNKVIEVLAAAVPLDAVFLGKLVAMLGVSLVGILVWGAIAVPGLLFVQDRISVPVTPALGWPAFCLLLTVYFAANYMLLGAVFLGIGGQASNVREIQTLSMPVTLAQVVIFLLASMVVGDDGGTMTWVAAIFPLSSPLAMISVAAQSTSLWPHFGAMLWQLLWIFLVIRLAARLFRLTVLKSETPESFFALFRARA